MKNILLLCLFIISFYVNGQNDKTEEEEIPITKEETNSRKISVGLVFSPNYNFRSLKGEPIAVDKANQSEQGKAGLTSGISILYSLHKNFGLESGLFYSDKGYRFSNKSLISDEADPTQLMEITYYHYFLEVPLKVNVFLLTEKLKLFLTGGMIVNIFHVSRSTEVTTNNAGYKSFYNSRIDSQIEPVTFSYVAGMGISYDIMEWLSVRMEPNYKKSISTSMKADPVKTYFYSFGINTGIYLKL